MMSREQNGILVAPPKMSFSDIAGRTELVSLLGALAYDDELDGDIGLKKARGVVLCGERGCGKSSLAAALTGELALQGYSCAEVDAAALPQDMKKQISDILAKSPCVLNIKNAEKLCDTGELDRILDEAESAANPLLMIATAEYETARGLMALRSFNFIYVDMPKRNDREAFFRKLMPDADHYSMSRLTESSTGSGYAELATLVNYLRLLSKNAYLSGDDMNIDNIVRDAILYGAPPEKTVQPAHATEHIPYSPSNDTTPKSPILVDDDDDEGYSGLAMFMK